MATPLILKRGDPSRRRDNDYDVLEDGKVVGRIFHLEAAAPEGCPWMWASGHGGHIERAVHGYERRPARQRWRRSRRVGAGDRRKEGRSRWNGGSLPLSLGSPCC